MPVHIRYTIITRAHQKATVCSPVISHISHNGLALFQAKYRSLEIQAASALHGIATAALEVLEMIRTALKGNPPDLAITHNLEVTEHISLGKIYKPNSWRARPRVTSMLLAQRSVCRDQLWKAIGSHSRLRRSPCTFSLFVGAQYLSQHRWGWRTLMETRVE